MRPPSLDDTIVAVSSGWSAAPLGVVRLSGPDSTALLMRMGVAPTTAAPRWTTIRLQLDTHTTLPATALWFHAPRSYTGQDVVELHTVGCLPLLRELSARLIELGARRALPGEFTARAYLAGKLASDQVEAVLALMRSSREADIRQAARLARGDASIRLAGLRERVIDLLALIEAGIDFVEEEDIRFISETEILTRIDQMLAALAADERSCAPSRRAGKLHVALVGPPNAGKSTLFNALVGSQRAIVSPVLGTTRDVISAEIELGGLGVVLQDCAGLGGSATELELATHLASERAARLADLVLWVHAADDEWDHRVTEVCRGIPPARRVLVWTKTDLVPTRPRDAPVFFERTVSVSVPSGVGLPEVRTTLADCLAGIAPSAPEWTEGGWVREAKNSLKRARNSAAGSGAGPGLPEIVCLELRQALAAVDGDVQEPLDERLLDRIFSEFCVGK